MHQYMLEFRCIRLPMSLKCRTNLYSFITLSRRFANASKYLYFMQIFRRLNILILFFKRFSTLIIELALHAMCLVVLQ